MTSRFQRFRNRVMSMFFDRLAERSRDKPVWLVDRDGRVYLPVKRIELRAAPPNPTR
ncbi:hypothetical protein [Paradevosia shaoguanensis]|uniref:hypothetical protein n=1 Tax=Paradevosia shaoguanensis TaxID=1335043 RepID=UPI0019332B7A|nr:hypothetical protein [Paradevosia shaoguanensis]